MLLVFSSRLALLDLPLRPLVSHWYRWWCWGPNDKRKDQKRLVVFHKQNVECELSESQSFTVSDLLLPRIGPASGRDVAALLLLQPSVCWLPILNRKNLCRKYLMQLFVYICYLSLSMVGKHQIANRWSLMSKIEGNSKKVWYRWPNDSLVSSLGVIVEIKELQSLNEVNWLLPTRAWNEDRAYAESGESRGSERPILSFCVPALRSGDIVAEMRHTTEILLSFWWAMSAQCHANDMSISHIFRHTREDRNHIIKSNVR